VPDPAVITEKGWQMLDMLPPVLRDSPEYQAAIHAYARELERLEAAIEYVRAQLNPITAGEEGLRWWEVLLGLPIEPSGQPVEQRRANVLALLGRLTTAASGLHWEQVVTELVGSGWSYRANIPGDPTSPAPNTIVVTLPFGPTSPQYHLARRVLRDITPANTQVTVQSEMGGFTLDQSQLDVDAMP
jgi:hypothetical protein